MANLFGDGIPIPNVIDPPDSMQMILCIPKNRDHMSAFFGALYQLTVWTSWQRNDTTQGKEVADVWWRYYLSWNRTMNDIDCEDGMAKCCTPNVEIKRFNPETGRPELSFDDGVTWTPDPADVQNQIPLYPPPVVSGGTSTKCDAATNASEHVNELITATSNNLETAGSIFELTVAIAEAALALFVVLILSATVPPVAIALATAIWAAGAAAFELGKSGFDAYWTTDKKDAILCLIYCNIGNNGQFTEEQYQAFRTGMKNTLPPSPAFDIVMTTINAGGARGMSQMASYGNAALADCSACSACAACQDKWQVANNDPQYGTIIERGDNYIIVEAGYDATFNRYTMNINTGLVNTVCCNWHSFEAIVGVTQIPYVEYCGSDDLVSAGLSHDINVHVLYSFQNDPFTWKVIFNG